MPSLSDDIALAHRLADAAGDAIRPFFRADFAQQTKADASPVTEADKAAERAIRALLEEERPKDGIIGEEFGSMREGASRQWVLDPIDGTQSFIAGRPIFGTLIALMQDGWPVLGMIDQPIGQERWVGATGRDTTFNGQPVKARACKSLDGATVATTSPHCFSDDEAGAYLRLVAACYGNHPWPVYGGDCYNYGLIALGSVDIAIEAGLKLHDFAALVPVVEGAGGHMCDWRGEPLNADSRGDVIAIGDPARIDDVLEVLHG